MATALPQRTGGECIRLPGRLQQQGEDRAGKPLAGDWGTGTSVTLSVCKSLFTLRCYSAVLILPEINVALPAGSPGLCEVRGARREKQ